MLVRTLAAGLLIATLSPAVAAGADEAAPPRETLVPLSQQALPDLPGKVFTTFIVDYPPGGKSLAHRHGEAFVYAYVLSGAIRSQLNDEPAELHRSGDSWYELPGTHHAVSENASDDEGARLLVVIVAEAGATLKIDDPR